MTLKELFEAFKAEAYDANVDPQDQYYWDSLAYGFAVAKGAGLAMALHLANYWSCYCRGNKTIEQIEQDYDPSVFWVE